MVEKTKKRKQKLVKHKRKNWKKTDINEIEEAIDDLRQQERTGGILSEKKDEELFFIDKTKSALTDDDDFDQDDAKTDKEKSLEAKLNNLKCYRHLKPDVNSAPSQEKPLLKRKSNSKRALKAVAEEVTKNKRLKIIEKNEKPKSVNKTDFAKDLWSKEDPNAVNHTNEYYLRTTKKLMPKKPKGFDKKPSALPHVELPHPGMSYNPTYEDHQDLLMNAYLVELEKLKKEEKIIRNLDAKIPKMSANEIEKIWLKEMSGGLFGNDDPAAANDEDETVDDDQDVKQQQKKSGTKKDNKKQLKKAQRQRNKLMEKLKKKQKENEKQQRIRESEIYRLKSIKKEIIAEEEKRKAEIEKREKEKLSRNLYGTKKISSLKYEEPEIEVKLSDEITGNLRNLKPEGDLLMDRYKSLQKRNIIEPRTRAKKQRHYWKKVFERKDVREITV